MLAGKWSEAGTTVDCFGASDGGTGSQRNSEGGITSKQLYAEVVMVSGVWVGFGCGGVARSCLQNGTMVTVLVDVV